MYFKILRDIVRPQWMAIIQLLKCSQGMSVSELSGELKMSYMGVKQHCVELEGLGYLDTWRRAKAVGRPEKVYRLTPKIAPLFPQIGNELSLSLLLAIDESYGQTAAERLLFSYFQKRGGEYLAKMKNASGVEERAAALARLRFREGCFSHLERDSAGGLDLVEHHCQISALAERYPSVVRMEQQVIERVLGVKVGRKEERAGGLIEVRFLLGRDK